MLKGEIENSKNMVSLGEYALELISVENKKNENFIKLSL